MKRFIAAIALALSLAIAGSGVASAISASTSPTTQTHAHGVSSHWTLTWGGTHPFDTYFFYDVLGTPTWYWSITGTSTTTKSLSTAFYPCTGTVFKQELDAYDQNGLAIFFSHATEGGGNPC